eukprot:scaffold92794_cov54-Phaeocystis_antarctica.AAC.5
MFITDALRTGVGGYDWITRHETRVTSSAWPPSTKTKVRYAWQAKSWSLQCDGGRRHFLLGAGPAPWLAAAEASCTGRTSAGRLRP